jgi:formylglycine-generating enzyme required for sulfatase activity
VDQPENRNSDDLEDPVDRQRLALLVKAEQVQIAGVINTRKSKRTYLRLVLITTIVILSVSSLVVFVLKSRSEDPQPINANQPPRNVNRPGPNGPIKHDMIFIPGGTFKMGRDDGLPQERPSHSVVVEGFFLDNTEVTNAEYAEFVRDRKYQPPSHWSGSEPVAGQEQWPVVNVSPRDAEAFAGWRSSRDGVTYRLPTEEEWEYAARSGGVYKFYPWGDRWEDGRAVVKDIDAKPVGSYPEGANRWGVVDLIGNVWEWTSSKGSLYQGNSAGGIPAAYKEWVVARGGSFSSDPNDNRIPISATYRDWFDPSLRYRSFGFRLARSAQ